MSRYIVIHNNMYIRSDRRTVLFPRANTILIFIFISIDPCSKVILFLVYLGVRVRSRGPLQTTKKNVILCHSIVQDAAGRFIFEPTTILCPRLDVVFPANDVHIIYSII